MYKKLHRRLTLFFTGIAGLILIAMSICCLYLSEKELEENHFLTFCSNINALVSTLEQQNTLTWEWLQKTSASQNYILAFYDNDVPLSYNRTALSDEESALAGEAIAYAKRTFGLPQNGSDYHAAHLEFSYDSNGDDPYFTSVISIRKNSASLTGVILLSKLSYQRQILLQRVRFLMLNIIGICVLLLFSYHYTGKLLAPVIEARKKQSAFIAAASHELRTPVAVISSSISAAEAATQMQKEHFYDVAKEESLRLSTLVDDLLLLTRADTGRFSLNLSPTELDTLLLNTYEAFFALAGEHGISLKIVLPDDPLPRLNCDGERIGQVLTILISNALSYGKQDGYVKLSLSYKNRLFCLTVEDNGIGISDQDKPFIFERFYRADSSRSQKDHFGLGLCIAKEIVDAHGGTITVTDTPGGGARFFILLKENDICHTVP